MRMSFGQEMRMAQKQVLAPRMIQSMEILQLPVMALEERIEQLFHEQSQTASGAWNRLFDETIASLRFRVGGQELAIEPVLNLMQDPKEDKRRDYHLMERSYGEFHRAIQLPAGVELAYDGLRIPL